MNPVQVLDAVKQAIATAYRKDFGNKEQEIRVELEEGRDMPTILLIKEVVDDVENDNFEISLADAKKMKAGADLGDEIEIDVTPVEYGRIAAQAAKQVILQKLQEAEKQSLYDMFKDREEELLTATVTKVEPNWVTLEIEGMTVSLPWREQIPGEHYYTGKRIRVYLDTVELTGKGPQLRISRTNPNLVKKLLELEIPEVRNGDVEIKGIARDAGFRSKVAVSSSDPRIDPIGACVGQKGVRIQAVMEEINGERVDMIEWAEDPIRLISTALQPAAISAVIIVNDKESLDEENRKVKKRAAVFVEEAQRPMAIGKKGQNIRLATDLTGYELDMYNYEELPAFKAKLAELKGKAIDEIIVGEGLDVAPEEEEEPSKETEGVGKKGVKKSGKKKKKVDEAEEASASAKATTDKKDVVEGKEGEEGSQEKKESKPEAAEQKTDEAKEKSAAAEPKPRSRGTDEDEKAKEEPKPEEAKAEPTTADPAAPRYEGSPGAGEEEKIADANQ